jgi:hypothetical protein
MSLIANLMEEVDRLRQAEALLEEIYLMSGPYQSRPIPAETWRKIQEFYNFDDSE